MKKEQKKQQEKILKGTVVNKRKLTSSKPLSDVYKECGGDIHELQKLFNGHGDYIATMIMAKFIEKRYGNDFYALNQEEQLHECVILFTDVMEDFQNELIPQ